MPSAIIIGAGVSGLVSALLLALDGWDVQVHERHSKAGGMLARYWRKGVPYETGFHYCGGVEHDDILGRCLHHLGVREQLEFLPMDPQGFDRLLFPDFEFRVPSGVEAYRRRLKDRFPHEAAGVDAFIDDMQAAVSIYGIYSFNSRVDTQAVLHWESQSLGQVTDRYFRDPVVKSVVSAQCPLYGVRPSEAPFGLHAIVLDHFLQGANRLRGGGDALTEALVARIQQLGGRVRLRSEVSQIRVENRRASGVQLRTGERLSADLVVASVHPRVVLGMLPPGAVRPAYRNRIGDQRFGQGHFGVYLELDGPPEGIGNANVYRLQSYEFEHIFEDLRPDSVPVYFAATPAPSRRPDGSLAHTLLLTLGLSWQAVAPWADSMPGRRPEAYKVFKQERMDAVIDTLCADFPGIRQQIVRSHASTPLSTQFFTRSPQGAMYGHYHSVDQMGAYRLPQFIKVRNFVQVGQSVFAPGVLGATLSAYYGVGNVLGFEKIIAALEAA